ncbi:hypothetical protein QJS10_CPA10g00673 [Acorus calamus]|uniref:Uncharacterized protein n=1 Tax=Acorus calamus TaxID=4465 RepID=A0AAV9E3B0_ACOCL|nr:hypothetical protein QJS10_CPA10g00673 [Acorus calamus]
MGNCVVLLRSPPERLLRIVKSDGKILEYKTSTLVREILVNFKGYAIGSSRKAMKYLPPEHQLRVGRVYYLLPLVIPSSASADRSVQAKAENQGGCTRIKVIITKQQLQELLLKKSSVEEVFIGMEKGVVDSLQSIASWRPMLETIPEGCERFID